MTTTAEKGAMSVKGISLFEMAAEFSGKLLDRPVIDQTGLKGRYDVRLDMSRMQAANPGGGERGGGEKPGGNPPDRADQISALIELLRDQLGLKFEGSKQPVDVLVVDHAERTPTAN